MTKSALKFRAIALIGLPLLDRLLGVTPEFVMVADGYVPGGASSGVVPA